MYTQFPGFGGAEVNLEELEGPIYANRVNGSLQRCQIIGRESDTSKRLLRVPIDQDASVGSAFQKSTSKFQITPIPQRIAITASEFPV